MKQDQDSGANSLEPLTKSDLSLLSRTLGDYSQQKPTMEWNTQKKIWQSSTENQLFEHWEPFLGTWPTSGMMRNGQVFELVMQEQPTNDSVFSSLPTPTVSDQYTANLTSIQQKPGSMHSVTLAQIVNRSDLLPTPLSSMKGPSQREIAAGNPKSRLEVEVQLTSTWGKFEPAIRRWETVMGRPAPAPTKPDGKDGNHRLSSKFTEWLMGLPDGWITNVGLTRNQELKACGNGVVPQQAELALRKLLA